MAANAIRSGEFSATSQKFKVSCNRLAGKLWNVQKKSTAMGGGHEKDSQRSKTRHDIFEIFSGSMNSRGDDSK